jgi:beta-glucanase (GH16 family)
VSASPEDVGPFRAGAPPAEVDDLAGRLGARHGRRLVWEDRFAGPAGAFPDRASWTAELGAGGWGNGELQTYTDAPENVALDGEGHLVLSARIGDDGGWTSARVITAGKRTATHALVEVRAKLPSGTGIWPAAWTLGQDIADVGWPRCGEIDLIETVGDARLALQTAHGPRGESGHWQSGPVVPVPAALSADFHTYSAECAEDRITFALDGVVTGVVHRDDVPADGRWPFAGPQYVLLNVAVGGSLPGPPDATTPAVASLVVDRVRLYA